MSSTASSSIVVHQGKELTVVKRCRYVHEEVKSEETVETMSGMSRVVFGLELESVSTGSVMHSRVA